MKQTPFSLLSFALFTFFIAAGLSGDVKAQLAQAQLLSGSGNLFAEKAPDRDLEHNVLDLINKQRVENNLPPLAWNHQVAEIARLHSRDMGWNNYFNHRGLDGKMVSDRAETSGIEWHMIGENIAMLGGFSDPIDHVVEGWMQSPGHRKNILDPRWKETGIGIFITANGTYYFTQVFLCKD